MSALIPSSIAPQVKKELSSDENSLKELLQHTTITNNAQPVLEAAHRELERVVFESHEGMSKVEGVGALVREVVPADVKEAMRRIRG